jgi:hypothetical protein
MAIRDKKRRDAIQERKNKTNSLFNKPESYSKKRKYRQDDDYDPIIFNLGNESNAAFTLHDFHGTPHASTSNSISEQTTSVAVASASFFPALVEPNPSQTEFFDSLANLPIHGEDETLSIHDEDHALPVHGEDETLHSELNEEMQE